MADCKSEFIRDSQRGQGDSCIATIFFADKAAFA